MIRVEVKTHNDNIVGITIQGHAQSDVHGKDLVCAGVSACGVGVLNALVEYGFLEQEKGILEMADGYINIVVKEISKDIQVILETLVIILKTIEESNTKYIKIINMEV